MADLTVAYMFRLNTGAAAVGLVLAEIDIWLTEQDRATGVDTVIWDGTQNPTAEMDNTGAYIRIYGPGDLDANNYYAAAHYTGLTVLETDFVQGAVGILFPPIGTAIEYTYTLTDGGGAPIVGAHIEITTDVGGTNVVWCGETDTFGVARDDNGFLPRLQPGTYQFWRSCPGYTFTNPDPEVVS